MARSRGGTIHLRIDDLDAARLRVEYLEDIFASLDWLGLDWDTGPRDPADFRARHSQRLRLPTYSAALERLIAPPDGGSPAVYACDCSRSQAREAALAAGSPGLYPGTCRHRGLPLRSDAAQGPALRLRIDEGEEVAFRDALAGEMRFRPSREVGDFVVRQKNGDPAYQLASVVDDEALGIDLVVRGADLLPSTVAQSALARRLGAERFQRAVFLHHGLIVQGLTPDALHAGSQSGAKISKSVMTRSGGPLEEGMPAAGASSLLALKQRLDAPGPLYAWFASLLGMDPAGKAGPADLLAEFKIGRIPAGPLRWEDFPSD
jgi:glutamyl-tRNA synthetase